MTSRLFAPLHGLRARLMLLVSVALAPMLVQALHELNQRYALNVAHARGGLLEAARQAAAEYAARVESARHVLAALAGQPAVRDAHGPACGQTLAAVRGNAPEYLDLVVSAPDGRVVCSALPPVSAAEGAASFRRADGRSAPRTTTLQVAASHPPAPTGQDSNAPAPNAQPSGDWVSDARASDRWSADGRAAHGWAPRAPNAWRPAYWPVGGVYDRPVVHLSHRERAPDGRVAFIVGAALDLDWLARRIGQTLTLIGASLALQDATGRTLARTAAWPSAGAGWVLNARAGPWDLTDRDGRSWVMATARVGDGAPARLLSLAVPIGTLYAPVERARRRDAASLAAVLTLALATAWFGAGFYLKRRVRPLLGAIRRMDAGDFSARAGVTGGDELGTLARAFDGMAGGLQRRECERDAGRSRFEELVDSLDGVVWEANAQNWKLSYISRRVETVLGLSVEACLASANFWAEVIHPDDLQRVFEDCEAAVARCETHELEYRVITRGGRELWAHEIVTVHPEGGRPVLLRGLLRDVSARKRVEAELTAVSAQLTTLITNLPNGVALETPDRILQLANPALCEMMSGGSGDAPAGPLELIGRHCREICNSVATRFEGDPEAFVARVEAVTAAARPVLGEKLVLKDSRVFERDYVPVLDGERLTGHLWHYRDVTERHAAMKEIETLAYYDPLTGLPNRRLLADLLTRTVAETQRHGQLLAVLFLDLDRFKTVNDSLGHGVGDRLLQAAAQRLKDCVRAEDTVARMGGDEFVVVLKGLQRPGDAGRTARQILAAFARPLRADGHDLIMSTSIGIALHPYDGAEADGLIRSADAAMYAAKSAGRGNYRFFRPEMNARALELLQMESRLRRALACDEFVLHYQPQYRLDDGRLTGMEALIRWQEPEWGLVSPARFIPIAEEAGLIREIGEWALREACRQNRAWQDAGLPHMPVAVNLSAIQFRQPGLAARVASILRDTGLAPDDLELELTESALMLPEDVMLERMQALGRVGVRLAIDDFGTGYSSLSYLKRFRLDKLKIDQTFVRDVCQDLDDAAIVRAVIGMAKNLRLTVIAEGVESAEQLAFLRSHGCDQVQGFFLGRPLPAKEMEGRLRNEAAQDLAEAAALKDSVPGTPGP